MQVREFDLRTIDKMLPCPFCGGEAELDTAQNYRAINGHFGNRVVVYCADCGADQGTCVEDVPDIHPNEVIERWNKRAALPPRELLREALEWIVKHYANQDMSHMDFRVEAYSRALDALAAQERHGQ